MLTLPEEFRHTITAVWGEEGKLWLDHLPAIIAACEKQWGLSITLLVPNLSYNFVAFAVRADGTDAILKMGVPNKELATEIEALKLYQGRYAVQLLEANPNQGAMLLQRLTPGKPLSSLANDEEATAIAARLMRNLPMPAPTPNRSFPTIAHWALAFNRLRKRFDGKTGPLPHRMVDKAERLFQELQSSSSQDMLLHGDLHHENILLNGDNWLAIDPKGVIGDPTYEAARFLHNPIPGFLSMNQPRQVTQRRVEIIAQILKEEPSRILAWAYFDSVLSACWSIEDNTDWQYAMACAEIFDIMVK